MAVWYPTRKTPFPGPRNNQRLGTRLREEQCCKPTDLEFGTSVKLCFTGSSAVVFIAACVHNLKS